ncbi:5-formyltetrahydrofolate cyclo-ligase [Desulfocurvibacter africanus]|uniref:5-formyltetrahydrofolate cyclo-ligase n=1 Tax=Desulfocurvibacter africanus TaxID=873 RepID=UPI000488EE64|nr:5-formyltetrahydrofolate cyclo-ligase [Desulfocurvibacter africanus]
MTTSKAYLRRDMLARRSALALDWVDRASAAIQTAITAMPAFGRAREVLLYMAVRNEVGTGQLLDDLLRRKIRVLLPRCESDKPGVMHLACLGCREELLPGAYGIPEPDPGVCATVDDFAPDLAIIPGLAFDRRGRRLGYGGGYYDRLLASPALAQCLLVAPAYSFQVVDELPVDPWDRAVHCLVTENDVIEVVS